MMNAYTVLTKNPLSVAYARKLQAELGSQFETVNLTELQRSGVLGIFRGMRRISSTHLLLTIEDESVQAILPILQLLAALTRSAKLEIVSPDLKRQPFRRTAVVVTTTRLLSSSARNALAAIACFFELARLNAQKPAPTRHPATPSLLYVNANLWLGVKVGGSVGHISGVINALLRKDYAVTFAACGGALMLDEKAQHLPLDAPRVFGFPVELNGYRFHRSSIGPLRDLFRSREIGFIYQRLSAANYVGVTLSRRFGVPLVTEYNGSEVWIAKNWGRPLKFHALADAAERAMLRHSQVVVTVSDVLRDELVERGVDPSRIVTYPNCIDERLFDPSNYSDQQRSALRMSLGIPEASVVVAFVGTFGQWHGVDVLAAAIERMATERPEWLERHQVRFMLIGDGLKMSEVRARVTKSEVARFCVLTGLVPQRDAPAYLAASDFLMSPHVANADGTRFFGSPTKLFEYMAMGKAIIASDLDQIGQVLERSLRLNELPVSGPAPAEDRLALLTRPGSVDDLIEGIRFVVENPAWREALGRNARQEVLQKYTWRHHVEAILNGFARQDGSRNLPG